ncbi:MAG: hypothetical protein AB7E80_12070 [Hyphomicrobiaceae bacterium]
MAATSSTTDDARLLVSDSANRAARKIRRRRAMSAAPAPAREALPATAIAEITLWDVKFALAAAAVELAVAAVGVSGVVPPSVALFWHLAVVGFLALMLVRRRVAGADLTAATLTLIAVSVSGPVGAVMALAAQAALARSAGGTDLLDAWYRRIGRSRDLDAPTRLSDRIAAGRTIDVAAPLPRSFREVMLAGSLADQQAALGLVARRFDIAHLPMLKIALCSDVPVIRVQAAAVAAHVRPDLAQLTDAAIGKAGRIATLAGSRGMAAAELLDAASTLETLEAARVSGLIDSPKARAAEQAAARLVGAFDAVTAVLPYRTSEVGDVGRLLDSLEARLADAGAFGALRTLRRRRRLASKGFVRLRRKPRRRNAVGMGRVV